MHVRQYQAGDETALATIHNKAFQHLIHRLPEIYQLRNVGSEDVQDWLKQGSNMLWIIESTDQIIGYAQIRIEVEHGKRDVSVLQFMPAQKWDLAQTNIAILPEYQKRGIGTLLVEEILEKYRGTAELASAHTFSDNIAGERFFSSLGFTMHDAFYYPPFSDKYPIANSSIYETLEFEHLTAPRNLNPNVTIRRATVDDAAVVAEIHEQNVWWCDECNSLEWSIRFIKGKYGHTVFVAEIDAEVAGSIDYYRDGRIGISGVLPEYKRRGIGSTMFYKIMKVMKKAGFKSAFVDSGLTQSEAIGMYAEFGFTIQRRQNAWIKKLM
ncbi:MAG: GNAT family N-acetyltransferase [Candidatus Thorarchaeota archaeon]|nr:GNAT family N-acetyltransferase [Candidatus Thorarchaeota archaeon]